MNGVLCAGNKEETNYVIIQLPLVCHSQIKCQIKVGGEDSVCLMECRLPAPECDSRGEDGSKKQECARAERGAVAPMTGCTFSKCSLLKRLVPKNESGRPIWSQIIAPQCECPVCESNSRVSVFQKTNRVTQR